MQDLQLSYMYGIKVSNYLLNYPTSASETIITTNLTLNFYPLFLVFHKISQHLEKSQQDCHVAHIHTLQHLNNGKHVMSIPQIP